MKNGMWVIMGMMALAGGARADHSIDTQRTFANGATVSRHVEVNGAVPARRWGYASLRAPYFANYVANNGFVYGSPGNRTAGYVGPYGGVHQVNRQVTPYGVVWTGSAPRGTATRVRWF